MANEYEPYGHWEACAVYEDGTRIEKRFEADNTISEAEDLHNKECWLLLQTKHGNCVWYSVNWVYDD